MRKFVQCELTNAVEYLDRRGRAPAPEAGCDNPAGADSGGVGLRAIRDHNEKSRAVRVTETAPALELVRMKSYEVSGMAQEAESRLQKLCDRLFGLPGGAAEGNPDVSAGWVGEVSARLDLGQESLRHVFKLINMLEEALG